MNTLKTNSVLSNDQISRFYTPLKDPAVIDCYYFAASRQHDIKTSTGYQFASRLILNRRLKLQNVIDKQDVWREWWVSADQQQQILCIYNQYSEIFVVEVINCRAGEEEYSPEQIWQIWQEIIEDIQNGILFREGDEQDLWGHGYFYWALLPDAPPSEKELAHYAAIWRKDDEDKLETTSVEPVKYGYRWHRYIPTILAKRMTMWKGHTFLLSKKGDQEANASQYYWSNGRFALAESFLCKAFWQAMRYYQDRDGLDKLAQEYDEAARQLRDESLSVEQVEALHDTTLRGISKLAHAISRIGRLFLEARTNLGNYQVVLSADIGRQLDTVAQEVVSIECILIEIKEEHEIRKEILETLKLSMEDISIRIEQERAAREKDLQQIAQQREQREKLRDMILGIAASVIGLAEMFPDLPKLPLCQKILVIIVLVITIIIAVQVLEKIMEKIGGKKK